MVEVGAPVTAVFRSEVFGGGVEVEVIAELVQTVQFMVGTETRKIASFLDFDDFGG